MTCSVKRTDEGKQLTLLVRLDDKVNRQMSCTVGENETSMDLANELVHYGLISEVILERLFISNAFDLNATGKIKWHSIPFNKCTAVLAPIVCSAISRIVYFVENSLKRQINIEFMWGIPSVKIST